MKLSNVFENWDFVHTQAQFQKVDPNSKVTQNLVHKLKSAMDKFNLAAITPQNLIYENLVPKEHFLKVLCYRDNFGEIQTLINPQVSYGGESILEYERCGSIELNGISLDSYVKRKNLVQMVALDEGGNLVETHFKNDSESCQASYIQHELSHLLGITISNLTAFIPTQEIENFDQEVIPATLSYHDGRYILNVRTTSKEMDSVFGTKNQINFDFCLDFHNGLLERKDVIVSQHFLDEANPYYSIVGNN